MIVMRGRPRRRYRGKPLKLFPLAACTSVASLAIAPLGTAIGTAPVVPLTVQAALKADNPANAAVPTRLPDGFHYKSWSRQQDGLTERFADRTSTITVHYSRFRGNVCGSGHTSSEQYNGVKFFSDGVSVWRCFESLPPLRATATISNGVTGYLAEVVSSIQRLASVPQVPVSLHLSTTAATINGYNLVQGLSYARVRAGLGGAMSCQPEPGGVRMFWNELVVDIDFQGTGSCAFPAKLLLTQASAERDGTHTSQGLTIGDPVSKLRQLYPRARRVGPNYLLAKHGSIRVYANIYSNGTVIYFRITAS
jgi:hypothetical protein